MSFPAPERARMLALKGVGPTVLQRLEQAGYSALAQLADVDPLAVTRQISQMMRSTCWHNSPQARAAIGAIVALARAADSANASQPSTEISGDLASSA